MLDKDSKTFVVHVITLDTFLVKIKIHLLQAV